ncbi:DUF4234 domain-containing protein [Amphibacillus jilinensis]|uniref:DUF4234 domain-containing protein n=1 Tax=Amphibacillus jilinensis TaxID=1216008 RepID=UPI0002FE9522|nr:DUF4234 domain-containing protein [Amphibacillus jilinensis]
MIRQRSVAMVIILSFITCGIYTLFWMFSVTEELASATDDRAFRGGNVILFTFLTCGIYTFFWYYIVGQKIADVQYRQNQHTNDNGLIYILLSVFGLGLVANAIIQSDMNKLA